MEKNNGKKSRFTLAIALVGALGVISIAYAAFSTTLNIKLGGTDGDASKVTSAWNIHFVDSINDTSGEATSAQSGSSTASAGSVAVSTVTSNLDTVTITGAKLGNYGDKLVYTLPVVNEGSIDGYISEDPDITLTATGTGTTATADEGIVESNVTTKLVKTSETGAAVAKDDKIEKDSTINWYLVVEYKSDAPAFPSADTTFTIEVHPNWTSTVPTT